MSETNPQAPQVKTAAEKAKNPLLDEVFVIDTTCTTESEVRKGDSVMRGTREHIMPLNGQNRTFTFHHDRPTKMHRWIALRFLKHEAFKLCDADGNIIHYEPTPRQPHEMREGEAFRMADHQTVARLDELTIQALRFRVCQMEGGDEVVASDKDKLVAWLTNRRKQDRSRDVVQELRPDEFVPEPELDDEAA